MTALHALLAGAIDYASTFPPANLNLAQGLQNFGEYRRLGESWALGSFVCPAVWLPELPALDACIDGCYSLAVLHQGGELPKVEGYFKGLIAAIEMQLPASKIVAVLAGDVLTKKWEGIDCYFEIAWQMPL